jgi:hypothetical protein
MSEMTVVVLSDVDVYDPSDKDWKKYSAKDGNQTVVGNTFNDGIGALLQQHKGQRVELDLKPASNPKYPPTITAVRAAVDKPEESEEMSKEDWRAKDRAADRRACLAIASAAVTANWERWPEPAAAAMEEYKQRTLWLAQVFMDAVNRERGEEPDAPFEPDDQEP